MAPDIARPSSLRRAWTAAAVRRYASLSACSLLVLFVGLSAVLEQRPTLAVYLLGFWHYYLYWLAFAFGAVPFGVFKRDAVAMKTVSVAILAAAYLATPLDLASLAVVAGGVLLNVRAATALGFDRTYYGQEVAGLPPLRIFAFPYSLIAHPMIVGNVAAFGGTLINPAFAGQWGPLAGLHVALNIGLLAMELAGKPREDLVRIGGFVFAGGLCAAAVVAFGFGSRSATPAVWLQLAAAVCCAGILYRCYTNGGGTEGMPRRT